MKGKRHETFAQLLFGLKSLLKSTDFHCSRGCLSTDLIMKLAGVNRGTVLSKIHVISRWLFSQFGIRFRDYFLLTSRFDKQNTQHKLNLPMASLFSVFLLLIAVPVSAHR